MTDTAPATTASLPAGGDAPTLPAGPAPDVRAAVTLAGLATLATALLYDSRWGIALPVFLAVLAGASLALNPATRHRGRWIMAGTAFMAILALLVEAVTPLSLPLAITAQAACLLCVSDRWRPGLADTARAVGAMLTRGPWRLLRDGKAAFAWWSAHSGRQAAAVVIARWLLPLGLGLVFCLLFAAANPVLGLWLDTLTPAGIDGGRVVFWMATLAALWPFVRVQAATDRTPTVARGGDWRQDPALGLLLSPAAIVRALATFNALFALQSALDVYYLWTGHALPAASPTPPTPTGGLPPVL
ncbi:DUF4153 domain-containing protein, partial [Azospirillum sp. B4]|uniref:DUF4153 domain-containing protein n=1 Tax=Azospirillum sp. B4 TaxID=95605 RepID=UPI0005CA71C7